MSEFDDAQSASRTIADECVGYRVRALNRLITRIYDEELRPFGIRFSQMNILTAVTLEGPIQPVEVARILSLEKSTLSRNVRIMEDNGWVMALPVPNGQTLEATPAGRRLLKRAAPAWRAAQDQVTELLGPKTASALTRAADRLRKKSS